MICIERFVYEKNSGSQKIMIEDIFLTCNGVVAWAYLDASQSSRSDYKEVLFQMANYGFVEEYAGNECLYGVRAIGEYFYHELEMSEAIDCYNTCRNKSVGGDLLSYEFHVVEK